MTTAHDDRTRCRLLTPPGVAAIAVIRVEGARAAAVVEELFEPAAKGRSRRLEPPRPNRLRYGRIADRNETVDDVLVSAAPGPDGQPRVDISAHGGIRVVERILMAMRSRGLLVDPLPVEASSAWPAAHRIEAEAIDAVTRARTRRAAGFALHQAYVLPRHLERLAVQAEGDCPAALRALRSLLDGAEACRRLLEGVSVAVVGPVNAGKSTLANRLFGAPRALVSAIPGTTRDWVAEPTAIRGVPVTVVDTPGARGTSDPLEALAIARGRRQSAEADLRLLVLDGHRPVPDKLLCGSGGAWVAQPVLAVRNKSDLPPRWEMGELPGDLGSQAVVVSALRSDGMAALEARLLEGLGLAELRDEDPGLFSDRQCRLVAHALDGLHSDGPALARWIWAELIGTC